MNTKLSLSYRGSSAPSICWLSVRVLFYPKGFLFCLISELSPTSKSHLQLVQVLSHNMLQFWRFEPGWVWLPLKQFFRMLSSVQLCMHTKRPKCRTILWLQDENLLKKRKVEVEEPKCGEKTSTRFWAISLMREVIAWCSACTLWRLTSQAWTHWWWYPAWTYIQRFA